MKLKDYDFDNFQQRPLWSNGYSAEGALRIHGHPHICALMTTTIVFTTAMYAERQQRRLGFFDAAGNKRTLPSLSKEEIMMLDMDYILSCVYDPEKQDGWMLEMFTNDRENKTWIDFVRRCPCAYLIAEYPSRMGPYNIQHWIFAQRSPLPQNGNTPKERVADSIYTEILENA